MPIKKGKGLIDILKDPIGTLKEALNPIPTKLNNISTKTLEEYGNKSIEKIFIVRAPVHKYLTEIINSLSMGKFDELRKKYGYDTLFHLSLVAVIGDKNIIIEKNEVININLVEWSFFDKKAEYLELKIQNNLILDKMIDKTLNYMGDKKFYDYDALGAGDQKANNCQNFINSILEANNLSNKRTTDFLYQDMTEVKKGLENAGMGYIPSALKIVTNLGSRVSRLIGKGKKTNNHKKNTMLDAVINNKFRFI